MRASLLLRKFLTIASGVLAVVLCAQPLSAQNNNIHIKGHITSTTGQPVPNATVLVKGVRTGISSDQSGNFEVVARPNATLIISSVSFASCTIKRSWRTTIEVAF